MEEIRTSWYVVYPILYSALYIQGDADFLLSTVLKLRIMNMFEGSTRQLRGATFRELFKDSHGINICYIYLHLP